MTTNQRERLKPLLVKLINEVKMENKKKSLKEGAIPEDIWADVSDIAVKIKTLSEAVVRGSYKDEKYLGNYITKARKYIDDYQRI